MVMPEASAQIIINCPPAEAFAAVADVTRVGDHSPECTGARWLEPATGPSVGARFEGDNIARLGPITLKKWTTISEITRCAPAEIFEFVAEAHTTWRYEFEDRDGATLVTESFRHEPYRGWQKFVYGVLGQRTRVMTSGMQRTLARLKETLELQ